MVILAGDIGGTKTHLALFEGEKWIVDQKYKSQEHKSLLEIVELFLSSHQREIEAACFGVAGPVRDGRCHATNLPWIIDSARLSKALKSVPVFLINDLEANAYGLSCLSKTDFAILNKGDFAAKGNCALIAAGTGLGEAGIYWDGQQHHPFACEGGHVDFAARSELEVDLWRHLKQKNSHVSYERILSGPGLLELFDFLIDSGNEKKPLWLNSETMSARIITEKALARECAVCQRVLKWFVSIYGSESGNVALKFLSLGGLYIGGGIAPKILPALQEGEFMKAFVDKGRFKDLLSTIPIKVVLNEDTALLGAAAYARKKS